MKYEVRYAGDYSVSQLHSNHATREDAEAAIVDAKTIAMKARTEFSAKVAKSLKVVTK